MNVNHFYNLLIPMGKLASCSLL